MKNTIIYLWGFPGTGKLTIAKEICAQSDVKLVDNHLICNPVFSLIHVDGVTPLVEEVWDNIARIRDVVFDTMVNLSAPDFNFVLTNALSDQCEGDDLIFAKTQDMANARDAKFLPVCLVCDEAENLKRVVSEDRKLNMKEISAESLLRVREGNDVFHSDHPNEITLDVTNICAKDAARQILERAREMVVQ